jgi:protein-disulfide isomerase
MTPRDNAATSHVPFSSGPEDAPVQITEYVDFECPYCARAAVEMRRLERILGPSLRRIFRHFPLTELHPRALQAAEAAEAAGAQGKFWEMHDLLFEHQQDLSFADLLDCAAELGLDKRKLISDLRGHVYLDKIQRDAQGGARHGVHGTPSFLLNGERYQGDYRAEGFVAAIEDGSASVSTF